MLFFSSGTEPKLGFVYLKGNRFFHGEDKQKNENPVKFMLARITLVPKTLLHVSALK